jgi:hypothetical protein
MGEKQTEIKLREGQYLVVLPFKASSAQGRELEYAVEGWRRHFKEDYLIVVMGDSHPVCDTGDDIVCVQSKRVKGIEGMYRQHLDYVNCLRKVRKAFPSSKGFIMAADDCYAVNDFDITDVKFLKQQAPSFRGDPDTTNGWLVDKARTRRLLDREGLPCRDFTTHVPIWYEWDKLEALWDKYDMAHVSYVMEDVYHNTYFPTRIPLQLSVEKDNIRFLASSAMPYVEDIKRAFGTKIWIANSPEGWTPALEKELQAHYGI